MATTTNVAHPRAGEIGKPERKWLIMPTEIPVPPQLPDASPVAEPLPIAEPEPERIPA